MASQPHLHSPIETTDQLPYTTLALYPESNQKTDKALDPITTLVQLSLIESPGTKVQIYGNQLFIQRPGLKQILDRTPLSGVLHTLTGYGSPPPSRNDYVVFKKFILLAAKWYKPHVNPAVKKLSEYATNGLEILKETYKGTTTEDSFTLCIEKIHDACSGKLTFDKSPSGKPSSSSIPIRQPSSVELDASSSSSSSSSSLTSSSSLDNTALDEDITFRSKDIKKRFKSHWTFQEIEDIVNRITIIRKYSNSKDLVEKVNADYQRIIVDAIIQKQVERLKALIMYNNSCEFIQTMKPASRSNLSVLADL